ncbi:MAG: uncharacterized protein JWO86_8199 [Myxococcaceae bacterium]|jgi:hypothetical protein|nr:uncharacterized protein [Myxococcaceae bacterium]MEA2746700.1 hypothetical protein [Myxococcales bacterium]
MLRRSSFVAFVSAAVLASACGQDDDPDGARVLWDKVNAGSGFHAWPRAPGYATRKPSFTAHANAVEIFVSPEVSAALAPPSTSRAVTAWPVGSIVVKEGFSSVTGGSRKLVAVMEKRADGWFWAEYDDEGESRYSGHPSVCVDCHAHRKSFSDWVYSFELPR